MRAGPEPDPAPGRSPADRRPRSAGPTRRPPQQPRRSRPRSPAAPPRLPLARHQRPFGPPSAEAASLPLWGPAGLPVPARPARRWSDSTAARERGEAPPARPDVRRGAGIDAEDAGPADEALAAAATAGDGAAFELLLRRYGARVLACLERLLGDHHRALDASQEVWIKVHRALPAFDAQRRFRPWLFAIAMNHARDRLRERPRREETLGESHAEEFPAQLPAPGAALLERAAIAAALARVPEPFRSALLLVDVAGQDYPEAAEALGLPVGTVKSRVHRARLCFRAAYSELEAPRSGPPAEPGKSAAGPAPALERRPAGKRAAAAAQGAGATQVVPGGPAAGRSPQARDR